VDEFIRYDHTGPEAFPVGYTRFIATLRKKKFTHAIHFKRHLRSELIGLFSGARVRLGFKTESPLQFLTQKVEYEDGQNVIEQNLKLVRALGIDADDRGLELWPEKDSAGINEIIADLSGDGPVVVIHPAGATQKERLWPGFGELAGLLCERLSARVVMIGAESERGLVLDAANSIDPPATTALSLSLPEVAELISRADLFAGTDSGPAHMADAVGTPGAILYAPHHGLDAQLRKWKPESKRYLAFTPERDCKDCDEYPCPKDRQQQCSASISAIEVAERLIRLYAEITKAAECRHT
jgi:ADP-heptose:LPS heptosyltransferase